MGISVPMIRSHGRRLRSCLIAMTRKSYNHCAIRLLSSMQNLASVRRATVMQWEMRTSHQMVVTPAVVRQKERSAHCVLALCRVAHRRHRIHHWRQSAEMEFANREKHRIAHHNSVRLVRFVLSTALQEVASATVSLPAKAALCRTGARRMSAMTEQPFRPAVQMEM